MLLADAPDQHAQRRSPAARVVAVLARAVAFVALLALLALTLPALAGWQRFVVDDDAMSPTLDHGAVIWDEAVPVDRLVPGDVLTFPNPGTRAGGPRRVS